MEKKYFAFFIAVLIFAPFIAFGQSFSAGDTNHSGAIDIVDALLIARAYVGLNPSNYYAGEADVDCSGGIDIVDALLCARYYVGLITSFPCGSTDESDITVISDASGAVKIAVDGEKGIPGGNNVRLLSITFHAIHAGSDPGSAYIGIAVDDLIDINGSTIGTDQSSLGLTVTIYSGTTTTSLATTTVFPLSTTSLPPGSGNAWLTPPGCSGIGTCAGYPGGMSVKAGEDFSLDLHVNTGNENIGNAEFTITYPDNMVSFVRAGMIP